jgi:hypothetical protein
MGHSQLLENCCVPRQIRETRRDVPGSVIISMAAPLARAVCVSERLPRSAYTHACRCGARLGARGTSACGDDGGGAGARVPRAVVPTPARRACMRDDRARRRVRPRCLLPNAHFRFCPYSILGDPTGYSCTFEHDHSPYRRNKHHFPFNFCAVCTGKSHHSVLPV